MSELEIRARLDAAYPDVLTKEAVAALEALAPFDADRRAIMEARIARRSSRARERQPIAFLDPASTIAIGALNVAPASCDFTYCGPSSVASSR